MKYNFPNSEGYFGEFGGKFAPETLMNALQDLEESYINFKSNKQFQANFHRLLTEYVGRPTPLYLAQNLTKYLGGAQIYLKREDLNHTGAHKINNCLGQIFLAQHAGKKRIIAETGAGQHGVATATVAALFGMECTVYMGEVDINRQKTNVYRMQLLGATVGPVTNGTKTLKDAISEAMRDWTANYSNSHYLLGSALGPHPYPMIVRDFQSIIGIEAKEQLQQRTNKTADCLIACVGGGSNAIGLFHNFIEDERTELIGVEAGGAGINNNQHAARFAGGKLGVLQGTKSYLLQDQFGQISNTHSVSAGLDYAAVGPEHAYLHKIKRARYTHISDELALKAFHLLCKTEGIIPALESSHAIAQVIKTAPKMSSDKIIICNLSGRGDKDIDTVRELQQ